MSSSSAGRCFGGAPAGLLLECPQPRGRQLLGGCCLRTTVHICTHLGHLCFRLTSPPACRGQDPSGLGGLPSQDQVFCVVRDLDGGCSESSSPLVVWTGPAHTLAVESSLPARTSRALRPQAPFPLGILGRMADTFSQLQAEVFSIKISNFP